MSKVSKLLFSCVLLGSTIGTVQAETQYVTENLNTYLRKGAGDQFKIAGAIQSGEAVTVLGQEGKYTLIRDNMGHFLAKSDTGSVFFNQVLHPVHFVL